MSYQVLISDEARGDLDAVAGFIKEDGSADAARKWLQGIFEAIRSLSTMPSRCSLAPETAGVGLPVRLPLHGGRNRMFHIYLLINDSKEERSVRVLHVRDWRGVRSRRKVWPHGYPNSAPEARPQAVRLTQRCR